MRTPIIALWACRGVSGISELPLRRDTLTALPDALIDVGDETYRTGMVAEVLADLAAVESTLAQRVELAAANSVLVASVAAAGRMLRRGTALMTNEQWSAANE